MGLLIPVGVVVVIAVVVIGIYNRLVGGQQQVRNAWAQIDVQLKRRHDLIPNLVNAVKGVMNFEQSTMTSVIAARNQAIVAKTPQESMQAETALSGALRGFLAVVESYPQLRSQESVAKLMEELSSTENKIAFSRQYYNDAVQAQNTRIATFSGVLFARLFGFGPESLFQVPEAERAAIEAVPAVQL